MSVHCHKSVPTRNPPTGLVPQLCNTPSYLTGLQVSGSGAVIVAVLRPVPFPKCASRNYTETQTTYTHLVQHLEDCFVDGFQAGSACVSSRLNLLQPLLSSFPPHTLSIRALQMQFLFSKLITASI